MKKIGEGYYYDVFEISPTRVRKTQTNVEDKRNKLQEWYADDLQKLSTKLTTIQEDSDRIVAVSKEFITAPELCVLAGNPKFIN